MFIFILLFQQFDVGSEVFGASLSYNVTFGKDTYTPPDTIKELVKDTIKADSLIVDTNIAPDEGLKSPVKYTARDSMPADIEKEVTYLYGDATVDYEDLHLKADYIEIDMNKKELYATGLIDSLGVLRGSPEFSQGDQKFRSNSIRYNFNSRKGKIGYVITQEGEGYIHGEVVKKDPENNFFIKKGQYTTCNLDTPHFAITSNRLKAISNNKIVTGPAYLTIEGVPTPLLIPFGFFPNKKGRSSGIIFPSFGESAERGFYFQHLGYYFGFNDYVTLALASDVYTKGSYTLDARTLYRNRYHYSGSLNLSYAYTINSEKELPDYSQIKDYHIDWTHTQDPKLNPNSNFSASVRAGSSDYYKNTISSINNFQSNTFQSSIRYDHTFPNSPMNLSIGASHTQNTITRDIHISAPDLSFNVNRITPFKRKIMIGSERWYEKISTSYTFRGTNYIDTKDTLLSWKNLIDNMKYGFQHSIPFSTSFNVLSYFNVTPSINYTERWYFKTIRKNWNQDSGRIETYQVERFEAARDYQASLGMTTHLYGMYQFNGGPVSAIRHVMTPSVSLSYRPDYGQTHYGYYKYVQADSEGSVSTYSIFDNSVYGGPANGPSANLNYSLDNNIEMKVKVKSDTGSTLKKVKIFDNLNIGGFYNIIADSMKLSPFRVSGRTTLIDKISLTFNGLLDPYDYDENNIDYDRFSASNGGPLVRLTASSIQMSFNLNQPAEKTSSKYSEEELSYINRHPEEYIDFNVPYNLSVSYSYTYGKQGNLDAVKTQSASFSGDLSLTPQWKIGFNSWYDITNKNFTSFSFNFFRDLHCWEMRMNWIPFGYQESWNFQINVKSSILQDLKLDKRKDFYDK